jgi:DNA-binding beta-propeller fold protein YncE
MAGLDLIERSSAMAEVAVTHGGPASGVKSGGRLFVLDLSGGHVLSMDPDGSHRKVIASDCPHPDGVAVDAAAGYVYWTNMGVNPSLNDGSIERANINGENRRFIVPPGGTFSPKQLHLDKANGKLYWSDREGMRVMRCNLDGSQIEILVQTGEGENDRRDETRWCVGISVDPKRGQIYWTQKGADNAGVGRILRAGINIPKGETAADRSDVEVFFNGLPEPIDLEIDLEHRILYWTDRGNPPTGNTVNRAPIDAKPAQNPPRIVVSDLMEGIGIALDISGNRMFVTDFAGSLYTAKLDGADKRVLLAAQGNLTGIAYAELL